MPGKICYLGDDHLQGAAAYLAGVMLHCGLPHDHVPGTAAPPAEFFTEPYALYVVSDYPAARFGARAMEHVVRRVERGAGLLMLGGWESFHGRLGEYDRSPLAEPLPVTMESGDDRRNCAQPCLIEKVADHQVLADLPWDQPPGIGGYNAVTPKPGSQTVLRAVRFSARREADRFDFRREESVPLLVVGHHGQGRTAALATDAAPHWVGGLVDWGDGRVVQDVAEGFIEVGNWYVRFFRNLLIWTGNL